MKMLLLERMADGLLLSWLPYASFFQVPFLVLQNCFEQFSLIIFIKDP